jgi:NAD(P)-dependent dehydrogenase (short-subunit alcohol dehydrogenase family)
MSDLSGRTALVTGAGGGIGRATAIALAEAGARVGIHVMANRSGGDETLDAVRDAGSEGIVVQGDLADSDMPDNLVAQIAEALGPIDILVNNSGIGAPASPDTPDGISLPDWDRVYAVNVRGALQCARACLPAMLEGGRGSIINIASIRGVTAARGLAAYGSSKGGVIALTQQMAVEYARRGVRVNAISPGFVESEMLLGYISRQPEPDAARGLLESTAAMNRIGRPSEIAEAVVFLASDDASFVTGANLIVDGGNMANGLRAFL